MILPGFPDALPLQGLIGGLMIGFAAAIMLLFLGKIAGVSGMVARASGIANSSTPRGIATAFVVGLPLGAFLMSLMVGGIETTFPASVIPLIIGGIIVGYGTRLGSGCTSGHGVCGMSRLSPRSITATIIFIGSGMITVSVMRLAGLI